jgi:hypothetical protein
MNRPCGILLAALAAAVLAAPPARGVDIVAYRAKGTYGAVGYEATIVWGQGEYLLDMWSRLGADSPTLAKSRQAAETALEQRLEAVFLQSVVSLSVGSRETAGSRIKATPALMTALKRLVGKAVKRRAAMASGNEELRLRYALPLYGDGGLLTLFAPAGRPTEFDRYLGFSPAAAYTGLVIYAKGAYPAWGRNGAEATLKPCLLPRIYDTDMNQVMDATQESRARIAGWGVVAYSSDLDEAPFLSRVGSNPLRVIARGVYGVGDTDIVISRDAARLLLCRDENRAMLAEGKILIVLDAENAPEPPPAAAQSSDAPLEEIPAAGTAARVKAPPAKAPAKAATGGGE